MSTKAFYHSVVVYKNGDFYQFKVPAAELEGHVEYNRSFRPGRATFIDGVCVHAGYLDESEVLAWQDKLRDWSMPERVQLPRC